MKAGLNTGFLFALYQKFYGILICMHLMVKNH
jgi:hypothetical protein